MPNNNRVYYATYAAGIAPNGSTTFVAIHGLSTIGISTKFNLEYVFEIGQLALYSSIENVPDVEVTCEKVIDGYPLIWHLATQGATEPSLAGRSSQRCSLAVSYFQDTQQAASGTPLKQTSLSGLFGSALNYTFPVQGNCTESVTLVGNDKSIKSSAFTFTGGFTGNDFPPSGIARRQHVKMGDTAFASVWPTAIPGINGSGHNIIAADGSLSAHIQSARTSVNLGRTPLYELGRRIPYFRTVDFPVEVRTDIEIYCQTGDGISADENSESNVVASQITIQLTNGDKWDLGDTNKCVSTSETGGAAQQGGGNRSITYSFVNFNEMTVTSESDPSNL